MDKNEFLERMCRCLDKADLESNYIVSDDPDEDSSVFVSDEGVLYFWDIKSPLNIRDIKKIKYNSLDEEYGRDAEVKLYFENCVIFLGMSTEYKDFIYMHLDSEDVWLKDDALMAYFDALNNNEVFLIENDTFYGYIGKESIIEIPENVAHIKETIFFNKNMIKKIVFSKTVEDIRKPYCFGGMGNLEQVILNEGLSIIGWSAFGHCKKLKKIVIPSTVKEIEGHAFMNSGLEEVEILSDDIEYGEEVFEGTPYASKNKNQ